MAAVKLSTVTWLASSVVLLIWIPVGRGSSLNIACRDKDDNCTSPQNSYCKDGVCVCLPGFKAISRACQLRKIGEVCSNDTECGGVPSSQCLNDTCQCISGFVPKSNLKECAPRQFAVECKNDSDCSDNMANSKCSLPGTCRCADGYVLKGAMCVMKMLGDNCTNGNDCTSLMNNSRCWKNKCVCATHYIREGDYMCRLRQLGDSCAKREDCAHIGDKDRVLCKHKQCTCTDRYTQVLNGSARDAACVKNILGSACTKHTHCFAISFGTCGGGKRCHCKAGLGLKPSDDNQTCEPKQLRDACVDDKDCQHVSSSACIVLQCLCAPGYKELIGEADITPSCTRNGIGDTCQLDSHCSIMNSICKNNICSCDRGFSSSDGHSQCAEKILQETQCSTTFECLDHFNNTGCSEAGLCTCEAKYQLDAGGRRCVFKYLEDPCRNDAECANSIVYSKCANNVCACAETNLPSLDKMYCNFKILGGMPCSSHRDCQALVQPSQCSGGNHSTCSCRVGYHSSDNFDACLDNRLQDACTFDEECYTTNSNSFCSSKSHSCECFPGFLTTLANGSHLFPATASFSKPFCDRRRIGDQSCDTKDDCTSAIANSTCGSCEDAPEGSLCHRRCQTLNDVDTTDGMPASDSLNSTAECSSRTCFCRKGFIPSIDGTRCEGRKLRAKCQTDDDCNGHVANSACWSIYNNICYCVSGFQEAGPDLCTKRVVGNNCVKDSDCRDAVSFSHCNNNSVSMHNNVCQCNTGYQVYNNGTECRKRQIGDRTCALDIDCSHAVNNSYCNFGICACIRGYYSSSDHSQCHRRVLHTDYCDMNLDCRSAVNNSVCENHRCNCVSGFVDESENVCTKRKIDDKCRINADCSDAVNNSACVNSTCRCVSGFVTKNDNLCVRRRIHDSTCVSYPDCADAVEGSHCHNMTCVCDLGYYASSDMETCLKRKLEETCNVTSDCNSVIRYSDCINGLCECVGGFDGFDENKRCVPGPTQIGQACHFLDQCQRIDHASTCNTSNGANSVCVCPQSMFVARNKTSCITLPAAVGHHCATSYQCQQQLRNSFCDHKDSCNCSVGYFVDSNMTTCHRDPHLLGDFCQKSSHCNKTMSLTSCEAETCVCEYGYTQVSPRKCVERPILPKFVKFNTNTTFCNETCMVWTNSRCVTPTGLIDDQCRCLHRHARAHGSDQCVQIQTYEIDLSLVQEAGKYDYLPLSFVHEYRSPRLTIYQKFANRILLSGLTVMFNDSESSPLKHRYVTSEIVRFQNLDSSDQSTDKGVNATVLLHFKANYLDATPFSEIYDFFADNLNISDGVLGKSGLKVATPFSEGVVLRDYNECLSSTTHDCDLHATCINTLGSYMCVCSSKLVDMSKNRNLQMGRACVIPSKPVDTSDLCSSDDCETRWEFVGLAVTLFLLIVMAFITYEIIQRKQTFTARQLYEKFGTTKIRKLRQASIKRLKERKKKKKEENKKRIEEEKEKKEQLKREKSLKKRLKEEEKKMKQEEKKERELAKKEAKRKKVPTGDDVEYLGDSSDIGPPSPVELMHPPTFPFSVTTEDSPNTDASSLPGSVNSPDVEMGFTRRTVSPIEESPV